MYRLVVTDAKGTYAGDQLDHTTALACFQAVATDPDYRPATRPPAPRRRRAAVAGDPGRRGEEAAAVMWGKHRESGVWRASTSRYRVLWRRHDSLFVAAGRYRLRLMKPSRGALRAFLAGFAVGCLLLGLALMLTGCSNPPQSGRVTAKNFHQPYTWYSQMCIVNSKYGCSVWMPLRHDEPARYELCLRADSGDTSHDKSGCFDVDPQTFAGYQVGQHYPDAR